MSTNDNKDFENSTIFDKPEITEKKKKPKKMISLIAGILVVALLGGGVFAVNVLFPKKDPSDITTSQNVIKVTDTFSSPITEITVKNASDTFSVIPYEGKDAEGNKTTYYKLKGYDNIPQNVEMVSQLGEFIQAITATRQLTDDTTNLKFYGLDKPTTVLTAKLKNGETVVVEFGAVAPDKSGNYCKTTFKKGIFLVSTDTIVRFTNPKTKYINTELIPAMVAESEKDEYFSTEAKLIKYESITLSGSLREKPIVLGYDSNAKSSLVYLITSPIQTYANPDMIASILDPLATGITAADSYVFNPTAKDLKQYKLDKPETIIQYVVKNKIITIKLSATSEEGSYAALVNDYPVIYKMSDTIVPYYSMQIKDIRYSSQYMEPITSVSNMTITAMGKAKTYNLTHVKNASSQDDVLVVSDGKEFNSDNFSYFYGYLTLLSSNDYTEQGKPGTKPYLSILVNYNTDKKSDLLEFTKFSDLYYFFSINGKGDVLMDYKKVEELAGYANDLANGKSVPYPWN
ncbi:MAG: hypothetical protein BGN88_07015 [Clostridiales bacterium 43-6]|nr:MAG: hypothetical protein BGN88_07015 [Clostridiales bacterium 43-6]